jgi:hypothetical protein
MKEKATNHAVRVSIPEPPGSARQLAQAVVIGVARAPAAARGPIAAGFSKTAIEAAGSDGPAVAAWLLALSADSGWVSEHANGKAKLDDALVDGWIEIAEKSWRSENGAKALRRLAQSARSRRVERAVRERLEGWDDAKLETLARRLAKPARPDSDDGALSPMGAGLEPALWAAAKNPALADAAFSLLGRAWPGEERGHGWHFHDLAQKAAAASPEERACALRVAFVAWPKHAAEFSGPHAEGWLAAQDDAMGQGWGAERWQAACGPHDAGSRPQASASLWLGEDEELEDFGELLSKSEKGKSKPAEPLDERVARAPSALWLAAKATPDFWDEAFWSEQPDPEPGERRPSRRGALANPLRPKTRWEALLRDLVDCAGGWPTEELAHWRPQGQKAALPLAFWRELEPKNGDLAERSALAAAQAWAIEDDGGAPGAGHFWLGEHWIDAQGLREKTRERLARAATQAERSRAEKIWLRGDVDEKGDMDETASLPRALMAWAKRQGEHFSLMSCRDPEQRERALEALKELARGGFDFDAPLARDKISFAQRWIEAINNRLEQTAEWQRVAERRDRILLCKEEESQWWEQWAPQALEAARLAAAASEPAQAKRAKGPRL